MPSPDLPVQPLLRVSDLTARYGSVQVLNGTSLEVMPGSIVALLGANGAGKTTVLRAICAMVRAEGRIELNGREMIGRSTAEVARAGVAHVPEGRGTFTDLSVEENLRVGGFARSGRAGLRRDLERIYQWLPRLAERRAQAAGSLSGGEQQMLAIGRALMAAPTLLLLDEPSFGLAPRMTDEVFRILREVRDRETLGMLLVEQNAARALQLADTAYLLRDGVVQSRGPAALLASDLAVADAYLGEH